MRSRTGEGTSLSARIKDAVLMARWVARVSRPGEPGPEPARMICPFEKGNAEEAEVLKEGVQGFVEVYDSRILSISASVVEASRRRGQYSQIWESQRIRRVLAAVWSDSVISWLKLDF